MRRAVLGGDVGRSGAGYASYNLLVVNGADLFEPGICACGISSALHCPTHYEAESRLDSGYI